MTARAVSTVVDVSLCLLLVAAAVLTLVGAPTAGPDPAADRAQSVTTTLVGSTATVTYEDDGRTRTAHGTFAGLLADVALASAGGGAGSFRTAVANATRPTLAGDGWRGQVVATWRPYDGSDRRVDVVVGPDPPAGVDVHAATTRVPSGRSPVARDARAAAKHAGYRGIAAVLADARFEEANASRRRSYIRATARDLRARFDSALAAARAVAVGRVRITVRTWSP